MTLKEKILAPIMATLAAVAMASAVAVPAAVADDDIMVMSTTDNDLVFTFDLWGDWDRTMTASKDDASATYVHARENTTAGIYLYVDSYSVYTGFINQTVGTYAYLGTAVGKYAIHQNVYENGFRLASLRAISNSSGHLFGEWSADSWGTYPDLN